MEDSLLITNIYPSVKNTFSSKATSDKFIRYVKKYIDKNNEVLFHNTPSFRLYFQEGTDRVIVYKLSEIDKQIIEELLKKLTYIDSTWKIMNDPFNVLMTMLVRYYTIKKDKVGLENALIYLSLSLYSSLHVKFFKFIPNENIMQYTVNSISNKYLFKQYGIILKAIYHTAITSHETYEKNLIRGKDKDITDYFINLRLRLNNLMKNFANEYYKNHKDGNYLNKQQDSSEEDNFVETDNISGLITMMSENVNIKFFSSNINDKFLRISCKQSNCDTPTLYNTIMSMKENERDKVRDLVRCILQVYLSENNNSYDSISTQKFIMYSISVYSKSNTKNQGILEIKSLLDYFLKNNCERYINTEREATKTNYRKGLYTYFVLFIQSIKILK